MMCLKALFLFVNVVAIQAQNYINVSKTGNKRSERVQGIQT